MKKLFKRKPFANVGRTVGMVVTGGVGCVAGAYATNRIIPKFFPEMPAKYIGLGIFALGILGAMAFENSYAQKFSEGVSNYGFLHITGSYVLPNQKADLGLSGPEDTTTDTTTTNWAVMRNALGATDPLKDVERLLDTAMERQISGNNTDLNFRDPLDPAMSLPGANANAASKSFGPAGQPSTNGLDQMLAA